MNLEKQMELTENAAGEQLTRVEIQSLDMDWLFIDNNAKMVLDILAESCNPKVLVKA